MPTSAEPSRRSVPGSAAVTGGPDTSTGPVFPFGAKTSATNILPRLLGAVKSAIVALRTWKTMSVVNALDPLTVGFSGLGRLPSGEVRGAQQHVRPHLFRLLGHNLLQALGRRLVGSRPEVQLRLQKRGVCEVRGPNPWPLSAPPSRTGNSRSGLYFVSVTAVNMSGDESPGSIGASAFAQIDFSVSPTGTVSFEDVNVGSFADQVFTVQNTRGGTVSGTASAFPPFSIVSGSPFTLVGDGATQAVTVRFTPTASDTVSTNANFTADGDTISRLVTGTGRRPVMRTIRREVGQGASIAIPWWGRSRTHPERRLRLRAPLEGCRRAQDPHPAATGADHSQGRDFTRLGRKGNGKVCF